MRGATFAARSAAALGLLWSGAAAAHPHVFVEASYEWVRAADADGPRLRVTWRFDPLYSSMILDTYRKGRNRPFAAAEVDRLRREIFDALRRVGLYMEVKVDGREAATGQAEQFAATVDKQVVSYQFSIPLPAATARTASVEIKTFDPEYMIEFRLAGSRLMTVERAELGPDRCTVATLKQKTEGWGTVDVDVLRCDIPS